MARAVALAVLMCECGYDWERADALAELVDAEAPAGMSSDDLFSALLLWRDQPRPHVYCDGREEEEFRFLASPPPQVVRFARYWAYDELTPSYLMEEAEIDQLQFVA